MLVRPQKYDSLFLLQKLVIDMALMGHRRYATEQHWHMENFKPRYTAVYEWEGT